MNATFSLTDTNPILVSDNYRLYVALKADGYEWASATFDISIAVDNIKMYYEFDISSSDFLDTFGYTVSNLTYDSYIKIYGESDESYTTVLGNIKSAFGDDEPEHYIVLDLSELTVSLESKKADSYAMQDFYALYSIILPDELEVLGEGVLANATALKSVAFGKNLTAIGNSAFKGCGQLSTLTIPSTVKAIGIMAFKDCSLLSMFQLEDQESSWYATEDAASWLGWVDGTLTYPKRIADSPYADETLITVNTSSVIAGDDLNAKILTCTNVATDTGAGTTGY